MSRGADGRRREPAEIEALLREFRRSGCSVVEFAGRRGIHWVTLYRWLRRFAATQPRLVPVTVRPAGVATSDWPELISPTGWRVRVPPGTPATGVRELVGGLGSC